jgi:hypothetical protein
MRPVVAAQVVVALGAWVDEEALALALVFVSSFLRSPRFQRSSGTNSPYGIRSWKCRITDVSGNGFISAPRAPAICSRAIYGAAAWW